MSKAVKKNKIAATHVQICTMLDIHIIRTNVP